MWLQAAPTGKGSVSEIFTAISAARRGSFDFLAAHRAGFGSCRSRSDREVPVKLGSFFEPVDRFLLRRLDGRNCNRSAASGAEGIASGFVVGRSQQLAALRAVEFDGHISPATSAMIASGILK